MRRFDVEKLKFMKNQTKPTKEQLEYINQDYVPLREVLCDDVIIDNAFVSDRYTCGKQVESNICLKDYLLTVSNILIERKFDYFKAYFLEPNSINNIALG